jgi:hypothetical protein
VLHFAFGDFTGVTFAVNPTPGFAYTSVVGAFDGTGANIAQAVKAGTGQQFVAAPVPQQLMALNFADVVTGEDHFITLKFRDGKAKDIVTFQVAISKTDNASDIAYKLGVAINQTAEFRAAVQGVSMTITPTEKGRGWYSLNYTTQVDFGGIIFETGRFGGPLLERKKVVVPSGQIELPE